LIDSPFTRIIGDYALNATRIGFGLVIDACKRFLEIARPAGLMELVTEFIDENAKFSTNA
jgi:hypothetical protein